MVEAGRLGHKTAKGWYSYAPPDGKANAGANVPAGPKVAAPETVALLVQHRVDRGLVPRARASITRAEVEERCLFGLVNEVSRSFYGEFLP
jgi:3-hydroxyacyl-CoA dehydrogenase